MGTREMSDKLRVDLHSCEHICSLVVSLVVSLVSLVVSLVGIRACGTRRRRRAANWRSY